MKFYLEPAKEIPIIAEVDVLVLGSGPAGFSAAINAARSGAKTMLVELTGQLGGVATTGYMSHFTGRVESRFYEELLNRTSDDLSQRHLINPERLKLEMFDMCKENNVELLLYTMAVDVVMESKDIINGVIVQNKSGRQCIDAKIIIDCTGDGDVAAFAGAQFEKGREQDGGMQPVTIMFKVAGVDYDKAVFLGGFESTYETPRGELQALARENLPHPAGHVLLYRSTVPEVVTINMTNCTGIDGTSAGDLTKGELVCRGQMNLITEFLREYVPGYENCYIIGSASHIGVRETRRFKGLYTLTAEDILEAKEFEDWCVKGAHFNFDVHNIEGAGLDKTGVQAKFSQSKGYTIPYRCLLPVDLNNLILAGRNISGTHVAHSNYRVMPICVGMGEAAGISAGICIEKSVLPKQVDIKEIQSKL